MTLFRGIFHKEAMGSRQRHFRVRWQLGHFRRFPVVLRLMKFAETDLVFADESTVLRVIDLPAIVVVIKRTFGMFL